MKYQTNVSKSSTEVVRRKRTVKRDYQEMIRFGTKPAAAIRYLAYKNRVNEMTIRRYLKDEGETV